MKAFYEIHKTDLTAVDDRMRLVVREAVALNPKRIIDLACGRGTILQLLRAELPNASIVGADISESSIAELHAKGFEGYTADVTLPLPFEADSFDCAIFGEVLEHLVDPDAALVNISRALRVGGYLVITTPNLASWFNRILLPLGVQPIFTETSLHVNLGRPSVLGQWNPTQGHLKIFTLAALLEMLHANGFAVERTLGAPFPSSTPFAAIDRAMARIPKFASNFVITARNTGQRETRYPKVG